MKKEFFVSLLLTLSFILTPFSAVNAEGTNENILHLEAQLGAILEYLERWRGEDNENLSADEMRQVINDGVEWIINAQEENGHFKYEYVPYEGRYNEDDNIVRQAGTLYALSEVYRYQENKDEELADAIELSIEYFIELTKESDEEHGDFSCAVDPKNMRDCRLGANSLLLTAILSYLEAEPEKVPLYEDLVEGYVSFILAAKTEDAGFLDKYRVGVAWQAGESPFSNGEALLALVRYYQYEPSAEVKAVIDETYDYLSTKEFDSGLYLWIAAAIKDMVKLWPEKTSTYGTYLKNFTDWRVDRTAYRRSSDKNYCAYTEGVASAYSALDNFNSAIEQQVLREEISYWNARNETLQIHKNDLFRLTNYDNVLRLSLLDEPNIAHGGFLTSHTNEVQRIDFTQHCISAYLQTLVDIEGERL